MADPTEPQTLEEAVGLDETEFSDADDNFIDSSEVQDESPPGEPDTVADASEDRPEHVEGAETAPQEIEGAVPPDEHEEVEEDAEEGEPEVAEASVSEPEPAESDPAPAPEPFSFRADGTEREVEGAVIQTVTDPETGENVEFVVLPRDSWNRGVQPFLADRGKMVAREQDLQREITDLKEGKHPVAVELNALLEEMNKVLELGQDEFVDWVQDFPKNRELLRERARNARLQAQIESREQRDQREKVEQRSAALADYIRTDLPQQVARIASDMGLNFDTGVDPRIRNRILQRLRGRDQIYVMGTDSDEHRQSGLVPGELYINDRIISDELELLRDMAGIRATSEPEQRRRANAAMLGKVKAPPPQVPAEGSAPASTTEEDWDPPDRDAWRKEMGLNT